MLGPKPVDLDHLDRYTGGDHQINAEILALFDRQCRTILAELEELVGQGTDSKAWQEISHRLKGAARGVGAFALGASAADAERVAPASAYAVLEQLKRDSAAVHAFIEELLKQDV
jgi:HPt (histidine-containing phosphotransfer) domain-containing protein